MIDHDPRHGCDWQYLSAQAVRPRPTGSARAWFSPSTTRWGPTAPIRAGSTPRTSATKSNTDPNQHVNPTTNTDIYLAYSDDGGLSWVYRAWSMTMLRPATATRGRASTPIPPTRAAGRSSSRRSRSTRRQGPWSSRGATPATTRPTPASRPTSPPASTAARPSAPRPTPTRPRPRSTRSRARPMSWARRPITSRAEIAQADTAFGYGDQMGLAVFDGQLYPIWAGNFNSRLPRQ